MSGFVYIWRDRKHARYYIGSHWGDEDDGYVCSSKWMMQAYKRRPQDFKRKILARIDLSRKDLLVEEARWLSMIKPQEIKKRYYNINIGKIGHWIASVSSENVSETISARTKAAMARPEVRARYEAGLAKRNNHSSDPKVRAKRSASMKATMAAKYGELRAAKALLPSGPAFGSEEYRAALSESCKLAWKDPSRLEKSSSKLRGRRWWNDGTKNTFQVETPGIGWRSGRLSSYKPTREHVEKIATSNRRQKRSATAKMKMGMSAKCRANKYTETPSLL